MRYENKHMKRIGDVFEPKSSRESFDLTDMRFLNKCVDTVKQMYDCTVKPEVLDQMAKHYDEKSTDVISFGGYDWKFSKGSKASRYQYILRNNEIGFVVLLKSYFAESDEIAAHLKIEVSPESIDRYGLSALSKHLRQVGSIFCDSLTATGVACHLAVDFKGIQLPDDFEYNLVTKARRQMSVNGISQARYTGAGAAFVHGNKESYLFGNASSLQFSCYRKDIEMHASGKTDYIEQKWLSVPSVENPLESEYKQGDEVYRVEFRFHQSIIKEFENGNLLETGEIVCIREVRDLKRHLRGLWLYALNNFRLQHSTTYIHPIWQRLIEDIEWFGVHDDFAYKRAKKVTETPNSKRNVAMYMGNYLKLVARKGLSTKHAVNHLLTAGIDSDLSQYFGLLLYGNRSELESMLYDFVDEKLTSHRLDGVGENKSIHVAPF